MRTAGKVLVIALAIAGLSVFTTGCKSTEKTNGEHPQGEHPQGQGEHPQGEHPDR